MNRSRESVLDFISTDLDLGFMHCSLAKAAEPGGDIERRNAQLARKSYESARSFLAKMPLTEAEAQRFSPALDRLRSCLETLDYSPPPG